MSEVTDLTITKDNQLQLKKFEDVWNLSLVLCESGLFGTRDANVVATKIVTGLEMGISPVRSVRHIDTINGQPSVSAQLSAAMIQMSKDFKYEVEEVSVKFNDDYSKVVDGVGRVAIYKWNYNTESWDKKGVGEFTWGEAVHAGLTSKDNWSSYPRDMLFARAMKRAKRMYAPRVGIGREYMPDELGEDESPTVTVPSEVQEKAKENIDRDELQSESTNSSEPQSGDEEVTDADFEVEMESDESEVKDTNVDDSEDEEVNINMDVQSEHDSETVEQTTETEESEEENFRAIPGGLSGHKDKGKIKQVDIELSEKEGSDKLDAIHRYIDYHDGMSDGDQKEKIQDVINKHLKSAANTDLGQKDGSELWSAIATWREKKKHIPGIFSDVLVEVLRKHKKRFAEIESIDTIKEHMSDQTVKMIKEIESNLKDIDDPNRLEEQLSNYENEFGSWDEPASTVGRGMIMKLKDERLPKLREKSKGTDDSHDEDKGRKAEFHENLNKARTILGMAKNEDGTPDTINKKIKALDSKVRNFKGGPTEEELRKWSQVRAPYVAIVKLREAMFNGKDKINPDDIDKQEFNDVIVEFSDLINSWDDEDEAKKAKKIVMNEIENINEKVPGFNVDIQG